MLGTIQMVALAVGIVLLWAISNDGEFQPVFGKSISVMPDPQ